MAASSDVSTSSSAMPSAYSHICLDIFYQNVTGLRAKQLEIYDRVSCTDYTVICLTETWLKDSCQDHNLFPKFYSVFLSDRKSSSKTRGGGVLVDVNSKFCGFKREYDIQFYEQCVWVELSTLNGENLLIGNHYLPPDVSPTTIVNYFYS